MFLCPLLISLLVVKKHHTFLPGKGFLFRFFFLLLPKNIRHAFSVEGGRLFLSFAFSFLFFLFALSFEAFCLLVYISINRAKCWPLVCLQVVVEIGFSVSAQLPVSFFAFLLLLKNIRHTFLCECVCVCVWWGGSTFKSSLVFRSHI